MAVVVVVELQGIPFLQVIITTLSFKFVLRLLFCVGSQINLPCLKLLLSVCSLHLFDVDFRLIYC